MKQYVLALRCGCTEQAIRDLELGRSLPSWELLVALCETLDVLPSELMAGAGSHASLVSPRNDNTAGH